MSMPGKWTPLDRFGQPIDVGDLCTFEPPTSLTFKVLDIKPILKGNVPPGSVILVLQAQADLPTQGGHPIPVLTRVGYVDPTSGRNMVGSVKRGQTPADPAPGTVPDPDAVRVPPVDIQSEPQTPDPAPGHASGPRLVI